MVKRVVSLFGGVILVGGALLWAQAENPERSDRPREAFQREQRNFDQNRAKNRSERFKNARLRNNKKRPTPFLMAGDPRFSKIITLALAPEDQVQNRLQQWNEFQEMPPERQQQFQKRIGHFRKKFRSEALRKAEKMGIPITDQNREQFIRTYWEKRIEVEKRIRAGAQTQLKEESRRVAQELKAQFQ